MTHQPFRVHRVSGMPISNDDLITDLRAVAAQLDKQTIGQKDYSAAGKYDYTTVSRRFGSWNKALRAAGLDLSNEINITDEQLFGNILTLWQHFGRQPRRAQLAQSPSSVSQSPYNRRFGSWSNALDAFVAYANNSGIDALDPKPIPARKETGRDPSLRLRWHVLQRDRFTCCGCGASPALTPGVELNVDHVIPWSKGGLTVFENLQTLCSRCNLGKSNTSH